MLTVKYVPELVERGQDNVISVLRNITGMLVSARVSLHGYFMSTNKHVFNE